MRIFQFRYLKNRRIIYIFFVLSFSIIIIGIIAFLIKWKQIQYFAEVKYKKKVLVYNLDDNGDTTYNVLGITNLSDKDSFLINSKRKESGQQFFMNFSVYDIPKNTVYHFIEYTNSGDLAKIFYVDLENKYYNVIYVPSKSIHFLSTGAEMQR